MPATQVCQIFFKKSLSSLHKYQREALLSIASTLTCGASLTLTSMGRHLSGTTTVKHKIKRVDRFLANSRIYDALPSIYALLTSSLTATLSQCLIVVDWSGCCSRQFSLLRASLIYDGRAIPLMTKVVSVTEQGNHAIHCQFLDELYQAIGHQKHVTILTDAGFKAPWFNYILSLGWHFIGRIRGDINLQIDGEDWTSLTALSPQANSTPAYLGEGGLNKDRHRRCRGHFYLYKGKSKNRKSVKQKNKPQYFKSEQEYSSSAITPWLIISSHADLSAKKIVALYTKRPQIEQNFRDEKSPRYGLGWRYGASSGVQRLSLLLLLASVASIILWLIGFMAENKGKHRHYQANSLKTRRVLSYLSLARNIIRQEPQMLTKRYIVEALNLFGQLYEKTVFQT